jgi:hypothetical protein
MVAVWPALVAALFASASGHSAARGSKSVKPPSKPVESVMACMKFRQQRLVEDQGLRMELRNCCHGPVKCSVSWQVRCDGGGAPDPKSADLQIAAGATESAYGYATSCGDDGWRISDVRWSCETSEKPGSHDDL